MAARLLREKTHPNMLVVTIREGEEKEICGATLRELLKIIKDQVEERSVVVIVLNKESAMWREESMKTLLHDSQLKYVDVDGMRVATNNRCMAEQIKSDSLENAVMDGPKVVQNVCDGLTKSRKSWKQCIEIEEGRDGWSQNWRM